MPSNHSTFFIEDFPWAMDHKQDGLRKEYTFSSFGGANVIVDKIDIK